jgi:hypothetical protein
MDVQRPAVKFHLVRQVNTEQRLADADERQLRHRRHQVELGAVRPARY